ncbi:MAG: type II toxin-antitoxin system YafQ family toxin [Kiritimatiellae bacterium]|nr:type II toxin-antitoxin system YafQ family toxin [Kiritimatiellia bacterium]
MYKPVYTNRFKKDVQLALRRGKRVDKLFAVIEILCAGKPLPGHYKDHSLAGDILSEDNSYQTLALPIELSSDITVSNNVSGGRIIITGHVSGSGGIIKDGDDYLQITASNSYDGVTLIKRGALIANDAYACGSTNGNTLVQRVVNGNGVLIFDGDGMDIYEALEFRNVNSDGNCFINKNGSNTLHSTYTIQGGRHRTETGATSVFIVNGGTLIVEDGSSLGNSINVVADSAIIHIKGDAAVSTDATLSINGSGVLNIDAAKFAVADALIIDDVVQAIGDWGTTASGASHVDDVHFSGSGILIVTGSSSSTILNLIWDAGAADNNFSSAANWEGDAAPVYDGVDLLTFGSAGNTSTVDVAASVHGIKLNRAADFVIGDGAGMIELGNSGIQAESTNSISRSYLIAEDIKLSGFGQTWEVHKNGAPSVVLDIAGDVSSDDWFNELRLTGQGNVCLSGDNSYSGATFVEDDCVLKIYHDNALGSTNQPTTVEDGGILQVYGGVNIPEPITIYGDSAVEYQGVIRSQGGSNTWSGLINCPGSRIRCSSGSLDIIGGVTGSQVVLGGDNGTYIRIAEKPMTLIGNGFYSHSSGGAIIIAVTNNTAAQANVNSTELRFDVVNAFNTDIRWDISNNGGAVNLNGNDQEIGRLLTRYATPVQGTGRVYTYTPATLTVNQSSDDDYRNALEGALSFVKKGASELRLYDTHSTTGSITVSEGKLTMKAGSSFEAVPSVFVTGGILALEDETTINNEAVLSIENSAVIDISAGLEESVGWLIIDGSEQRGGTYGATGSGAQNIDDIHFSGSGVIKILHDNSGTMIILR